jgi:hypothetical protein
LRDKQRNGRQAIFLAGSEWHAADIEGLAGHPVVAFILHVAVLLLAFKIMYKSST